jgi:hypothetical protein
MDLFRLALRMLFLVSALVNLTICFDKLFVLIMKAFVMSDWLMVTPIFVAMLMMYFIRSFKDPVIT